jgi:large subunit ribosomal protein L10
MSKFVKDLLTGQLKTELGGVNDVVLISLSGIDAVTNSNLRARLRQKKIHVRVVKNSLARRATEGTVLAPAFAKLTGPAAVVWGAEDMVALAKEIVGLEKEKEFKKIEARGGAMDGAAITADALKEVSKWPSRPEQLSILMGQILSVGGTLAGQIGGPAGEVASQIKQKGEGEEGAAEPAPAAG